jgi:hypothetical protein
VCCAGPALLDEGTLTKVREAVAVDGLRALDGLLCLRVHLAISDVFRLVTTSLAALPRHLSDALYDLESHATRRRSESSLPWNSILERLSSRQALHAWGPLIQVCTLPAKKT